jgi:uncharacterized protein (TIGR04255 family)
MHQPSFNRPPLVETILGVQFDRLQSFTNGHLGLFWKALGEQWSAAVDAPLIPTEFEQFGGAGTWSLGLMGLKFSQDPSSRLQIKTVAGDRMIQLQNGKLLYNWMGQAGEAYPRFSRVKAEFDEFVGRFQEFVGREHLGDWRPNQWEVSYLNHLPRESVWQTPSDWSGLLRLAPQPTPDLGAEIGLESVQGQWHYEIRPRRGRLHVALVHGRTPGLEGSELLVLTLTARGPISHSTTLDDGIRLGHDVIVHSFASLTSDAARQYWEQVS